MFLEVYRGRSPRVHHLESDNVIVGSNSNDTCLIESVRMFVILLEGLQELLVITAVASDPRFVALHELWVPTRSVVLIRVRWIDQLG